MAYIKPHDCDCESCKELRELLLFWWRIKAIIHSLKWLSGIAGAITLFYVFFENFGDKQ